jgi:hypothetical protein
MLPAVARILAALAKARQTANMDVLGMPQPPLPWLSASPAELHDETIKPILDQLRRARYFPDYDVRPPAPAAGAPDKGY